MFQLLGELGDFFLALVEAGLLVALELLKRVLELLVLVGRLLELQLVLVLQIGRLVARLRLLALELLREQLLLVLALVVQRLELQDRVALVLLALLLTHHVQLGDLLTTQALHFAQLLLDVH